MLCKKQLKDVTEGWFGIFSFQKTAEVDKDLWGHLVQPLLQQSHPEHPGCPGPCPERFWIYSGTDPPQPLSATCSSPWSPLQLCDDQTEPPVFHFVLAASWTPLGTAQCTFFNPSFRYLYPPMRLPRAISPVSWTVPVLSAIPRWNFQYYFPASYFSRHLQT